MLTQVRIENFKGIVNTSLNCKQITLIVGDNRQGKTSSLRAIEWALGAKTNGIVINSNAGPNDESRVRIETDKGLVIERKMKKGAKKNLLSIHRPDGNQVTDPDQLLNRVFNPMAFDPIRLITMDPKTQASVVREALASAMALTTEEIQVIESFGGQYDPNKPAKEQLETLYKKNYDERTGVNRVVKTLREKAKGATVKTVPSDTEIASAEKLIATCEAEFSEAMKTNARIEAAKKNEEQRVRLERMIAEIDGELKEVNKLSTEDSEAANKVLEQMENDFQRSSREESELRGSIRQIETVLASLGESKFPICPISNKISCTTDIGDTKASLERELTSSRKKVKKLFEENKSQLENIEAQKRLLETLRRIGPKKIERDRLKSTLDSLGGGSGEKPIDIVPLKSNLDDMRNALAEMKAAREIGNIGELEKLEADAERLDQLVNYIKQLQDVDLPKRMELGIPDLRLEADGLYFRNLPLQDECTSTQLRIAAALIRKLFPSSKILTIDRMEVLSEKTLIDFINKVAQDINFQIIGTYVGNPPAALKSLQNVQIVYMEKGTARA